MTSDYEKAISFKELYKSLQKSQRNVMWKDSVAGYSMNGLKNTYKLRKSLLDGSYKLSQYQRFKVYEPKEREILATRIRDRQYQRSVCDNILYPEMTRHFIRDNCACQKGRGVDDALNRMKVHLRRHYRKTGGNEGYVLQCDIKKYFPSTPHKVAVKKIAKAVRDKEAVACACSIVTSFCEPKIEDTLRGRGIEPELAKRIAHAITVEKVKILRAETLKPEHTEQVKAAAFKRAESLLNIAIQNQEERRNLIHWALLEEFSGVGLGSQVSQLVELLVLNDLDHFIKERLHIECYIRYMDDFILLHPEKEYLQYCRREIIREVEKLGLTLNEKTELYEIRQGIKFLKWRFILTDTGKVVMRMSKKSISRQRRKMRKLKGKLEAGEITIQDIQNNFHSWMANAERGNTKAIRWKMTEYYNELFEEVIR